MILRYLCVRVRECKRDVVCVRVCESVRERRTKIVGENKRVWEEEESVREIVRYCLCDCEWVCVEVNDIYMREYRKVVPHQKIAFVILL